MKKVITIAIVVVAALSFIFIVSSLNRKTEEAALNTDTAASDTSMTSTSTVPSPSMYVSWTDGGRTYIAAKGTSDFDPATKFAGSALRYQPADSPAFLGQNSRTFTITSAALSRSIGTLSLARHDGLIVHLIGEVHLGGAQVQVAKTSCAILAKYEIDGVLLEQPDDAAFDWQDFSFVNDKDSAIAQLQYATFVLASAADAAEQIPSYLRTEPYRSAKNGQELLQMITAAKGEEEAVRVASILMRAGVANELYKTHKYISAADYLYVLSRLKGFAIPFYGIESSALRDAFEKRADATGNADLDTTERDQYMALKAIALGQSHNLRRVILICGAAHIPTLTRELESRGAQVLVEYEAPYPKTIKPTMAIIENRPFVQKIMTEHPPASFHVDPECIVEPKPSAQITDFLSDRLAEFGDSDALMGKLSEAYISAGARSKNAWEVRTDVDADHDLLLTRKGDTMELTEETFGPASLEPAWENVAGGQIVLDMPSIARAARINDSKDLLLLTIEDKGEQYVAYSGIDEPLYVGNDFTALMSAVKSRMGERKSVYFDMKGFSAAKSEAFASNCRRNASEDLSVQFLERDNGGVAAQDALFSPGIRIERAEARTVEAVTEGPRKGWFRVVIDFFVRQGDRLTRVTMAFYSQTAESLQKLQITLTSLFGQSTTGELTDMSLAQIVVMMRRDLSATVLR
jgi:hypothetical protein